MPYTINVLLPPGAYEGANQGTVGSLGSAFGCQEAGAHRKLRSVLYKFVPRTVAKTLGANPGNVLPWLTAVSMDDVVRYYTGLYSKTWGYL